MKRDMTLIRELLLKLEQIHDRPFATLSIPHGSEELAIEGYSPDEISYNLELMVEGGLLLAQGSGFSADGALLFQRLSWNGHEYLESVRDPEVWRLTKEGAAEAGGAGIAFMWDLAKAYSKHVAKERLGIDLP